MGKLQRRRKVIAPLAAGLDPETPSVSAHGDIAVEVCTEDGIAVQTLQHLGRGMTVAVLRPDRDHVDEGINGGHDPSELDVLDPWWGTL